MSNIDAEMAAFAVVRMFGAVSRAVAGVPHAAVSTTQMNTTNVVPLHAATG
jgi:hypothetical protein